MTFTAIEFFSGIGAFSEASRGSSIQVLKAFDQNSDANDVYKMNHGARPSSRNLDTVSSAEIPAADIWWMSPPCKPYTVRGNQLDDCDPRSLSLQRLIELLEVDADRAPDVVLLENVRAFENSQMHSFLVNAFDRSGYDVYLNRLCSTDFGVPMKRPRIFFTALKKGGRFRLAQPVSAPVNVPSPLRNFLCAGEPDGRLLVADSVVAKYAAGLNIIDPMDATASAICFTSGYRKSFRASGSLMRSGDSVRRFSPDEILALLGFSKGFAWPDRLSLEARWRLAGNSVDVRCIRHLLAQFLAGGINVPHNG